MNVEQRVVLMEKLGRYIVSDDEEWAQVKEKATNENPWFIPEFINYQLEHIANAFLNRTKLENWISRYDLQASSTPKKCRCCNGRERSTRRIS